MLLFTLTRRRPTPRYYGRSPIERRILIPPRMSRKQQNGERDPTRSRGAQIVEALVCRLNGRMVVQSTAEGTTVTLLIPLAPRRCVLRPRPRRNAAGRGAAALERPPAEPNAICAAGLNLRNLSAE
jgi:hypothetical protein